MALRDSHRALNSAIADGFDESEEVDQYVVRARYNPCKCDAPDDEIYVHGRWTRARLDGDAKLLTTITQQFHKAFTNARLITLALRGSVDDEDRTPQGLRYLVFQVESMDSSP